MSTGKNDLGSRRDALKLLGSLGLFVAGCGGSSLADLGSDGGSAGTGLGSSGAGDDAGSSSGTDAGPSTDTGTTSAADAATGTRADSGTGSDPGSTGQCTTIPDETAGPYPDKIGMLGDATYKRSDVREDRAGLALNLVFSVVNTNATCAAVAGATVMIWQCDASGDYSEYSQPGYDGTGKTYLRGYQETDSSGQASFLTVYPGWYAGRVTHIHIEVYVDGKSVKTTQLAFPDATSAAVYATAPYSTKGQSPMTNAQDQVFSDGDTYELVTLAGSTSAGYTGTLTLGIAL